MIEEIFDKIHCHRSESRKGDCAFTERGQQINQEFNDLCGVAYLQQRIPRFVGITFEVQYASNTDISSGNMCFSGLNE